ncbi:RNA polymerase sigma factor [Paraliomyxa miuraensis]|uniref:RNA polymerase sigma factor n=1 Tax=Paraliomyxa miuraensis TaxID=376150 RepID=UPI002251F300|nr:sigma-70 family RNA polymerase sigma factor [Paraliomyxa miuraensis]MCX4247351.1 sigma-70 family RNA polymerase sigma factor [Paraliomyxa miuraensis]
MNDDHELLHAWRSGDPDAGQRLIERHLESVHRFFSNKVPGSTDDLVQRTFLACVEAVDGFEGRASFRSYLFAIARNILYRHYRERHQAFDPLTVSASTVVVDQRSPADRVTELEEQRLLLRALRALPLELQTLLELAYWEGLADRELAEILELPAGTIKSRLRKARQQLEELLPRLARSPGLLESSRQTLEAWAAGIRDRTGIEGGGRRR